MRFFLLNINQKFKLNHKLSRTGIIKHILRYLLTKFVAREVCWKIGVLVLFLKAFFFFQKVGSIVAFLTTM